MDEVPPVIIYSSLIKDDLRTPGNIATCCTGIFGPIAWQVSLCVPGLRLEFPFFAHEEDPL